MYFFNGVSSKIRSADLQYGRRRRYPLLHGATPWVFVWLFVCEPYHVNPTFEYWNSKTLDSPTTVLFRYFDVLLSGRQSFFYLDYKNVLITSLSCYLVTVNWVWLNIQPSAFAIYLRSHMSIAYSSTIQPFVGSYFHFVLITYSTALS